MQLETFPWLTLGIALAFGFYGVLKKQVKVDTLNGLFTEVMIMVPVVLAYLLFFAGTTNWIQSDLDGKFLLMLTAPVTLLPLILFAYGVKRANRLSSIAILQYVEPTLYFLIATFVFSEPLSSEKLTAFILVWIGFLIFAVDSLLKSRNLSAPRPQSSH